MSIVGTIVSGRYRIDRLLGEGGMGAVYEAEHTLMHKRVAVKVLHAEMSKLTEVVTRFEREAMAAGRIEHPNVASATDFGKLDDGSFFLVLEFIEGKSLRENIAKGPFPARRAIHVARQIASALSRAHGLGIVHRDLKPENVMLVERDGDPDFVKVLDFGIAKVPVGELAPKSTAGEKALTQVGMVYGTPEYMPPEQALGQEVDLRADLYALGIITYEMLAGARPFDDDSKVKLLTMQITAAVPPFGPELGVPPELAALVMKLLQKEASDRIQDAREVIDALEAVTTPPPVIVTPEIMPVASAPSLPHAAQTNATVLALSAHAESFAGEVTRIVPTKILLPVLGLFGLVTLITGVVLLGHASGVSPSTSSASASATASASSHFEVELKRAQVSLALGDNDAAIMIARSLANEEPMRPESHHILFQAHLAKGDPKAALADAIPWLTVEPSAERDPELQGALKAALASKEDEGAAFALLESGKLGPPGADLLYDMAYGSGQSQATQSHARRSLVHPDVTMHASPALQVTVELRNAKDCESKRELLDKAGTLGDARTLSILETYSNKGGCGFLGMKDCNSCMHKDDTLTRALTKLRERAGH